MSVKRIFSLCGKCALILAAGGVMATLLLTLFFYIPVKPQTVEKIQETVYLEGDRPMANALHNQGGIFVVNFHPAMLDNGTDSLMLNTALVQGDNALVTVMDMNNYPRYWHGYFLILRSLLYVMDYEDLRILHGIIQLILVFVVAVAIRDVRKEKRYLWAFLTSYILLTPITLPFSLQYTWTFYIAFGGILFAVRKREFLMKKSRYVYFFFLIGMITVFFDFLTFPLITWAFPLIWWLVASGEYLDSKERIKKVIVSGLSWIGGYGGFWFLKWCIATPILGYNVIDDGIQEVVCRVGGLTDFEKSVFQVYEKWEALYCNWRYFEYGIYAFIITAWMLWALWYAIWYGWQVKKKSAAFLLISVSSVVWYLTLANHTMIHSFFTHRIFVIGILGFLCFLMECVPCKKELKSRPWRDSLKSAAVWAVAAAVGLGLARGALEDISVLNGGDYQEVPLQEGEMFQTTFMPSFDNVMRVGFCLKSEEGVGTYRIEVMQDSQVLYYLERELSDYLESTYHEEIVYWKLHGRKEYQMQISFHGTRGENFVLMTNEGWMPLNEYRDANINGISVDGQILGSFCYHTSVRTKWRRIYAALMWMMSLGAAASVLKVYWTEKSFKIK